MTTTGKIASLDLWKNASLTGLERSVPTLMAMLILDDADTGSAPLQVIANDNNVYWVKPQFNPHGQSSLLAERIVSAAGKFLGAPTISSELITIPSSMGGYVYSTNKYRLTAGTAHASPQVNAVVEDTVLDHVGKDGNSRRAPGFIALWEWCFGEDEQWLYDTAGDFQMWSFDHGTWIGGGGQWGIPDLVKTTNVRCGWEGPVKGMDPAAFMDYASRLEACSVADVLSIVAQVPIDWGFSDSELIAVAKWLYERREHVITNLKRHATNA